MKCISASASDTCGKERMNHYAGFLRGVDRGIDIRTNRVIAAEPIDTVRDQQNLAAGATGNGPTFNQTHDRKINAGIGAAIPERNADSLGYRIMIRTKLGKRLNRSVAGVEHSNRCAARLRIDKAPNIVDLSPEFLVVGIIDDNGELKQGLIALGRDPVSDFSFLFSLKDIYILLAKGRRRRVFGSQNGDNSGHTSRSRLILSMRLRHAHHESRED